jgi:hypothetical protein
LLLFFSLSFGPELAYYTDKFCHMFFFGTKFANF